MLCVPSEFASPRDENAQEMTSSILKVQCMLENEKCERAQAHVDVLQRLGILSDSVKLIEGDGSDLRTSLLALETRINEQIHGVRLSIEVESAERGASFEHMLAAMTVHGQP